MRHTYIIQERVDILSRGETRIEGWRDRITGIHDDAAIPRDAIGALARQFSTSEFRLVMVIEP